MKKISISIKLLVLSIMIIASNSIDAQVSKVKYNLNYVESTNIVECNIIITEGQASEALDRIQFSSQYSIVVPKDVHISIEESFSPLVNNRDYNGVKPCDWFIGSEIGAPEVTPDFNYFGIVPSLSPTSYFNDLNTGDTIKLFEILVTNGCVYNVRLWENDSDPFAFAPGFNGAEFSQGYTIGGYEQLYDSNVLNPNYLGIEGNDYLCVESSTMFSSNEGVSWTSSNQAIASVDVFGEVTGHSEGTAIISATSDNGCATTSKTINVLGEDDAYCYTGLEPVDETKISIFPNPTSGLAFIDGVEDTSMLELLNINGQKIPFQFDTKLENIVIDTEGLISGIYILKIKNANSSILKKFEVIKK